MDTILIQGGVKLQGKVRIQGSKNASLPILAATILTCEDTLLKNCPRIADVYAMLDLLQEIGCCVAWNKEGVVIRPRKVSGDHLSRNAVASMRSSICLLGALIGRCHEVVLDAPGGCCIGARPIDIHLQALSAMGIEFWWENDRLHACSEELQGTQIKLPFPSVGATENVILAAVMAEGETRLEGFAREPEVFYLCDYLRKCGADITFQNGDRDCICIRGGKRLLGVEYTIPADRIVAGTYLFACVGAGGSVLLENAPVDDLEQVLQVASEMGASLMVAKEGLYVHAAGRPLSVRHITTRPYPGFPTDLQSAALAALSVADGVTQVEETIFENRFHVVEELQHMGARIQNRDSRNVTIEGVESINGCSVTARELRGGAALVVAGIIARGTTTVCDSSYIYRGYENICRDFRELGARITGV